MVTKHRRDRWNRTLYICLSIGVLLHSLAFIYHALVAFFCDPQKPSECTLLDPTEPVLGIFLSLLSFGIAPIVIALSLVALLALNFLALFSKKPPRT